MVRVWPDCMKFEDTFAEVLLNMEASIVHIYHENPGLQDKEVAIAVDALIGGYIAEEKNRPEREIQLPGTAHHVYQNLMAICEWSMGRVQIADPYVSIDHYIEIREVLGCLKRIKKSIRFWKKKDGPQGYLRYVSEFV